MNNGQGETRHRPRPTEITPDSSPQSAKQETDASAEVDQAAREIQAGSLQGELRGLGESIDQLRSHIDQDDNPATDSLAELDVVNQRHRLAIDELDHFQSRTASDWKVFRTHMKEMLQELRDKLDLIRQRIPGAATNDP